jgi:hypothetical protein
MIETNEPAVELQPIKEAITKLREFVNDPQFTVFQKDPIYMFSAADAANA